MECTLNIGSINITLGIDAYLPCTKIIYKHSVCRYFSGFHKIYFEELIIISIFFLLLSSNNFLLSNDIVPTIIL